MTITNVSFDGKTEQSNQTPDAEVSAGDGGGVLDVWKQDRPALLADLAGVQFTNASSFKVPPGILNNGFDTGSNLGDEFFHGVSARGTALDIDGTPLPGTAVVSGPNEILAEESGSGSFIASGSPPSGVTSGENQDVVSYDFEFTPDAEGASLVEEDIGIRYDAGAFQYGSINGTVTNFDDELVSGAPILAPSVGTSTGNDGGYELLAPGGRNVDVTGVGTTVTVSVLAGETVTQDFQFSRLVVKVVDPNQNPVVSAPVDIGSKSYLTDENGEVTLDRAEVKDYNVSVSGVIDENISISSQGSLRTVKYGESYASLRLLVKDGSEGGPVFNLPAKFISESGIPTKTDIRGKCSCLVNDSGEVEFILGEGDNRYQRKIKTEDVTTGSVKERTLAVERKENISNY